MRQQHLPGTPMHTTNTQHGYVALSAMLVASAVLLVVISQSILRSSASTQTLISIQQAVEARTLSHACLEIALEQFLADVSYRGDEEKMLEGGTCDILPISTDDVYNISIEVEGTIQSVTSRQRVTFDTTLPHVTTTIWEML
jgi:hypothetical protein